jgi:AP-1-like factor
VKNIIIEERKRQGCIFPCTFGMHTPMRNTADDSKRRRAQNRASQRAFRDRKEKQMKDLEEQLAKLQGQHDDLTRSYESLQLEYSSVKQELDELRKDKNRYQSTSSDTRSHQSGHREWAESTFETMDPLLFDGSAFRFEQGDDEERR